MKIVVRNNKAAYTHNPPVADAEINSSQTPQVLTCIFSLL
jgi:hypothetical protein